MDGVGDVTEAWLNADWDGVGIVTEGDFAGGSLAVEVGVIEVLGLARFSVLDFSQT